MESLLSVVVDNVIKGMHMYNSMLQYRPAQDAQCLIQKGKVEGLCELLKDMGYPLTVSTGRVWHLHGMRHETGYGCIMFAKEKNNAVPGDVLYANNFEGDIYWFMEGNSELIKYKGRRC